MPAMLENLGLAEGEPYIKLIDCPTHPNEHQAVLFCYPHESAGMWECPETGESEECPHPDTIHEVIEVDTMRNGEHDTYETEVETCLECGVQVDV